MLVFEKSFHREIPMRELISIAAETRDDEYDHYLGERDLDSFALMISLNIEAKFEEIDKIISGHSQRWATKRLSRVSLAVLRLALFEIFNLESIPTSVSINEAVELAKKYGGEEDFSFVNGLLGSIVRNPEYGLDAAGDKYV